MEFYGQHQEDRLAYRYLKRFPKDRLHRTFLDIGAYDGRHLSNTYLFEQLGWTGVCVEPDAEAFGELQKNRKCVCLNMACSDHEGSIDFYTHPGRPMGTTNPDAVEQLATGWRKKFEPELRKNIPCQTLDRILDDHGFREIDFVSIDVDGAEVQVLRGFDLKRAQPKLICIETNLKKVEAKKWSREHVDEIDRIITAEGYQLFAVLGPNSFYAKDRHPRLTRFLMALGL